MANTVATAANSVHSEVQSSAEQHSTAALPLQRPRTGPHRSVLPCSGSLDQVCLQELVPLWTLVIFFSCYAVVRLLLAVKQLGQGSTQTEGFSLRQGLRMLAHHVSEEGERDRNDILNTRCYRCGGRERGKP